jgi:hypothetical protein
MFLAGQVVCSCRRSAPLCRECGQTTRGRLCRLASEGRQAETAEGLSGPVGLRANVEKPLTPQSPGGKKQGPARGHNTRRPFSVQYLDGRHTLPFTWVRYDLSEATGIPSRGINPSVPDYAEPGDAGIGNALTDFSRKYNASLRGIPGVFLRVSVNEKLGAPMSIMPIW